MSKEKDRIKHIHQAVCQRWQPTLSIYFSTEIVELISKYALPQRQRLHGIRATDAFYAAIELLLSTTVSLEEILEEPTKCIHRNMLSGRTKTIVVGHGGSPAKLGYEIIVEMANRGCVMAKDVIAKDKWQLAWPNEPAITPYNRYVRWTVKFEPDRENPYLIDVVENCPHIENAGGWTLHVRKVPVENWAYRIYTDDDMFGSERLEMI